MKKKFEYKESRGLPGGPNEMFAYVTGVFSTEGYKADSPDVNNPFNIIPSGNITMEGVNFPVKGTDNLGNTKVMIPGNNYKFPGDIVFETPMAQNGKENTLDYRGNTIYGVNNMEDYRTAYNENRVLSYNNDGQLEKTLDPVTIVADRKTGKQYPYYDQLTEEEKKYFNDSGPIGRQIRSKATNGVGVTADGVKDFAMAWLRDLPLASLQAPQSALVEGVEGLRGNEFNMLNAITPGQQRVPSDVWGFETTDDMSWYNPRVIGNFAMDMVADPMNVVGAGVADDLLKLGLKQRLKQAGRYVPRQLPSSPNAVSVVDDVGTGNIKSIVNSTKNEVSTALKGTSSLLDQIVGELKQGKLNKKSIAEGNKWLQEWINSPYTRQKIYDDINKTRKKVEDYSNPSDIKKQKELLDLIEYQSRTFTPNSKEYNLLNQFKDNLEQYIKVLGFNKNKNIKPIHSGNWGVSYQHDIDPYKRQFFSYNPEIIPDRYGSWISRAISLSPKNRISTTIHEGTHDWVSAEAFKKSGMRNTVLKNMDPKIKELFLEWEKLRKEGIDPASVMGKDRAYQAYLANPTEMHARIMELRYDLGIPPSYKIGLKNAREILEWVGKGDSKVDPRFLDVIGRDPKKLAYLFNKLWASPPVVIGAGTYGANQLMNQQPESYKRGGSLPKAQDGTEGPWGTPTGDYKYYNKVLYPRYMQYNEDPTVLNVRNYQKEVGLPATGFLGNQTVASFTGADPDDFKEPAPEEREGYQEYKTLKNQFQENVKKLSQEATVLAPPSETKKKFTSRIANKKNYTGNCISGVCGLLKEADPTGDAFRGKGFDGIYFSNASFEKEAEEAGWSKPFTGKNAIDGADIGDIIQVIDHGSNNSRHAMLIYDVDPKTNTISFIDNEGKSAARKRTMSIEDFKEKYDNSRYNYMRFTRDVFSDGEREYSRTDYLPSKNNFSKYYLEAKKGLSANTVNPSSSIQSEYAEEMIGNIKKRFKNKSEDFLKGLSSKEYNLPEEHAQKLAEIAMAIMFHESGYGQGDASRLRAKRNFTGPVKIYRSKKTDQPKEEALSAGLSQIDPKWISPDIREEFFPEYLENTDKNNNEIARKLFRDKELSGQLTAAVLYDRYEELKRNPNKYANDPDLFWYALMESWKNPSGHAKKDDKGLSYLEQMDLDYADSVFNYLPRMQKSGLLESEDKSKYYARRGYNETKENTNKVLRKFQPGGELTVYKDYVNGLYDGTPKEDWAKQTYDKLNRIYYKSAKDAGMSVPNYIMSKLVVL